MGMDLIGPGRYLYINVIGWAETLSLAYKHGWQPAGTVDPLYESICSPDKYPEYNSNWEGENYSINMGQLVTEEDALGIAEALERAINDKPNDNAWLEDIIPFCRKGLFRIW